MGALFLKWQLGSFHLCLTPSCFNSQPHVRISNSNPKPQFRRLKFNPQPPPRPSHSNLKPSVWPCHSNPQPPSKPSHLNPSLLWGYLTATHSIYRRNLCSSLLNIFWDHPTSHFNLLSDHPNSTPLLVWVNFNSNTSQLWELQPQPGILTLKRQRNTGSLLIEFPHHLLSRHLFHLFRLFSLFSFLMIRC